MMRYVKFYGLYKGRRWRIHSSLQWSNANFRLLIYIFMSQSTLICICWFVLFAAFLVQKLKPISNWKSWKWLTLQYFLSADNNNDNYWPKYKYLKRLAMVGHKSARDFFFYRFNLLHRQGKTYSSLEVKKEAIFTYCKLHSEESWLVMVLAYS